MTEHNVAYSVDGHHFTYTVEGALAEPEERCLLLEDDDLTQHWAWGREGYAVVKPWPQDVSEQIRSSVRTLVTEAFEASCNRAWDGNLEQYHHAVSDAEHLSIVTWLRDLPITAERYFPLELLNETIGHMLGIPVTCYNTPVKRFSCNLRIVRPERHDNNPLHRDAWLDRLRHGINLYMPIAGSTPLSSLSLIPRSHYWKESEIRRTLDGSSVKGAQYSVPSVVGSVHGLSMIRPPVRDDEILLFSPYCIHGGARNLNKDATRVSLEMRFWRRP